MYAWFGHMVYLVFGWPIWAIFIRGTIRPRVVVLADNNILLTRTWIGKQNWEIPGGGKHKRETDQQAVCRELLEETGLSIDPNQLENLKTATQNQLGHTFRSTYWRVSLDKTLEVTSRSLMILDAQWFKLEELPDDLSKQDKAIINKYIR